MGCCRQHDDTLAVEPGTATQAPPRQPAVPQMAQAPDAYLQDEVARALCVPWRTDTGGQKRSTAAFGQPALSCPSVLCQGEHSCPGEPSKLVTVGPHRGHHPPDDHGQQRTQAVEQHSSSAASLSGNHRSSKHPGSLSRTEEVTWARSAVTNGSEEPQVIAPPAQAAGMMHTGGFRLWSRRSLRGKASGPPRRIAGSRGLTYFCGIPPIRG
jgi:hypothetical protein